MKPNVPSTCCCCCTLRQGSLVLGWFSLVGAVLSILSVIKELAMMSDIQQMVDQELYEHCDADCRAFTYNFLLGVMIVCLVIDIIMVVLSALLLYGINKKRPHLMTPYLVYMLVSMGLMVVVWVVVMIFAYPVPVFCVVFTIIWALVLALEYHFICVIYGHQQEIVAELGNAHIPLGLEETGHSRVII